MNRLQAIAFLAGVDLDKLPDAMLRWFACDCAQRVIDQLEEEQYRIDTRSIVAIQVARRHAMGMKSDNELQGANNVAHLAIVQTKGAEGYSIVASYSAYQTTVKCALAAADKAANSTTRLYSPDMAMWRVLEMPWLVSRLRYLFDVWQACGDRAPHLLSDGLCPISFEPLEAFAMNKKQLIDSLENELRQAKEAHKNIVEIPALAVAYLIDYLKEEDSGEKEVIETVTEVHIRIR